MVKQMMKQMLPIIILEIPDENDEEEIEIAEEVSDHNENLIQVDKQCLCAITDHKCHATDVRKVFSAHLIQKMQ